MLISGRGSNLLALIRAIQERRLDATIAVVISNVADAPGLEHARLAGIETLCISHRGWPQRDDFDRELARQLRARQVSLVCLAGFMRLVGRPMLDAFPHAILNIHPSLLPAFPGVDAQQQALDYGVRIAGATVHFVTPELDGGPIIDQRAVDVQPDDTAASLSARILEQEHQLYPAAVATVLAGGWYLQGRRLVRSDGADRHAGG